MPSMKMVKLKIDELPKELREGFLCEDQDEDEIIVPKKYVIKTFKINNDVELDTLMANLRFWGIKTIPREIYDYIMKPAFNSHIGFPALGSTPNEKNIDFTKYDYMLYYPLDYLANIRDKHELIKILIENKQWGLLEYLVNEKNKLGVRQAIYILRNNGKKIFLKFVKRDFVEGDKQLLLNLVIEFGDIDVLQQIHYISRLTNYSCAYAARGGNIEMLRYVYKYNPVIVISSIFKGTNCKYNSSCFIVDSCYNIVIACVVSKCEKCFQFVLDHCPAIYSIRDIVYRYRTVVPQLCNMARHNIFNPR